MKLKKGVTLCNYCYFFPIFVVAHLLNSLKNVMGSYSDGVIRNTKFGKVQGFMKTTEQGLMANVFLGIPYAKPPVDQLQFEYPQQVKPWNVTHNATFLRPMCLQLEEVSDADCLYLNIYAPHDDDRSKKYPVLVWIHGGSFQSGGANNFNVDGTIDNLVNRGLVVVFINYRLGFFGFASTLNENLPGNYGLEDQLMALKWVKDNIGEFSGNSDSITIGGESSGAGSVSLLGVSPKATDYFHKMIMRSGSSLAPWSMRNKATERNTQKVLSYVKCSSDKTVKECLRKTNLSTIIKAVNNLSNEYDTSLLQNQYVYELFLGNSFYSPVKDDYRGNESILPDYAENLMHKNAHLPIMIGSVANEFLPYVWIIFSFLSETVWNDLTYHIPLIHYENADKVKNLVKQWYNISDIMSKGNLASALTKLASDEIIIYGTAIESSIYAQKNVSVYVYIFDYSNDNLSNAYVIKNADNFKTGAAHGFDMTFLFQSTLVVPTLAYGNVIEWSQQDLKVINFLADSMYNFISTGNPSTSNIKWPKYSSVNDNQNATRINGQGADGVDYYSEMVEFWRGVNKDYYRVELK